MKPKNLCLPLLVFFTLAFAHAQGLQSGEGVLRAMHDRYAKSWYANLTFTQKSTTYNDDGTNKVETWYEALELPAKLRIDIGPPKNNDGYLMVDENVTIFKGGKESGTRPLVNMLLVLGFDVYGQAPEKTAEVVKADGYDLSKVHEESWEGQPVYVVGAEKGDLKSKQFWIEEKRLLFVRLFEPTQTDPKRFQDIRFEDYREMAGGWVAARVEVYADDKKVFSEEYSGIRSNVKLDPGTFDPKQFNSTHWEKP
jgi:hypothetical protein